MNRKVQIRTVNLVYYIHYKQFVLKQTQDYILSTKQIWSM